MQNVKVLHDRLALSHLPALDGLRFVAVSLVILNHMGFEGVPAGNGVMLFFALSGFLITWLLIKESEATGTISLRGFFKRRALRIFPAFYAFLCLTLGFLFLTGRRVPWEHALSSALYFSNYFSVLNPDAGSAFSHTWSLAVEEQFYLLFPVLFLLFCKSIRQLTIAVASIILAVWLWRLFLVFGYGVSAGYIYNAFDTRLDNLLAGCLLAILLRARSVEWLWRVLLSYRAMAFMTIGLLAASIYTGFQSVVYKTTLGVALEPLLLAALIAQMIVFSETAPWKWLEWRPVKFLGALSYSLYLYQQLTTSYVADHLGGASVSVRLAVVAALTVPLAALSYYFIELPFLKLKTTPFTQFPAMLVKQLIALPAHRKGAYQAIRSLSLGWLGTTGK